MSFEKMVTFVVVIAVLTIGTVVIVSGTVAINDAMSAIGALTGGL